MDSTAFNFNPNANTLDTCIAVVFGCIYDEAVITNFNPLANTDTDPTSCEFDIFGKSVAAVCIDAFALNYFPFADVSSAQYVADLVDFVEPSSDEPVCEYPVVVLGCTDPLAFNYDPNANFGDGSCIPVIIGCMNPSQFQGDYYYNVSPTPGQNLSGSYYGPTTIFYNSFSFCLTV